MGTCTKVAYATEKMANEDIDRIQAKSTRAKKPVRSYQCYKCNHWHLTSSPDYKALYEEAIAENKKLRSSGIAKSYELKIFKLQTKLKEKEAEYNKERSLNYNSNDQIQTLQATINKKSKQITKLQKDNADLINKLIVAETKWHTPDEIPQLIKECYSDYVLIYSYSQKEHFIGYYDHLYRKFVNCNVKESLGDFVWTNLTTPKK